MTEHDDSDEPCCATGACLPQDEDFELPPEPAWTTVRLGTPLASRATFVDPAPPRRPLRVRFELAPGYALPWLSCLTTCAWLSGVDLSGSGIVGTET